MLSIAELALDCSCSTRVVTSTVYLSIEIEMQKWNVFFVLVLAVGLSRSQQSNKKCIALPRFKCSVYSNRSLTPDPSENEYTVYRIHVRYSQYCFILAPDQTFTHLRSIESIGKLKQVKFLDSPGFNALYESLAIDPNFYGYLVTYNVSCPTNHTSFFYIIETEMREADCSGSCRDQQIVIDKGTGLGGLSEEVCGNDTASLTGHFERSSFLVKYRTKASAKFRGFRSAIVCFCEQQLDQSDCTDVNEAFQFDLIETLSDVIASGRRTAVILRLLLSSSQVVVPALQLEHACNPILRAVAVATLESAYSSRVERIRSSLPIVGFLNDSLAVSESDGAVVVEMGILRGTLRTNVTLNFSTKDSSALADVDYRGVRNLQIPLSNATSWPVSIKVYLINDITRNSKGSRMFTVRLSLATPSLGVLLAPATAEVSIIHDALSPKEAGKHLDLPVFVIAVIAALAAVAVILAVMIFTACTVVCIKKKKTPPKEKEDIYDVPETPPPPPSSPHTITLPMSRFVRKLPMSSNIAYGVSSSQ